MEIQNDNTILIIGLIAFLIIDALIIGIFFVYRAKKAQTSDLPNRAHSYSPEISPMPMPNNSFQGQDLMRLMRIMAQSNDAERLVELRNWHAESIGSEREEILDRYLSMYEGLAEVNKAMHSSDSYLEKADRKTLQRLVNGKQFPQAIEQINSWRSNPNYHHAIVQLTQLNQAITKIQSSFSKLSTN
jgi:hypothetical protein